MQFHGQVTGRREDSSQVRLGSDTSNASASPPTNGTSSQEYLNNANTGVQQEVVDRAKRDKYIARGAFFGAGAMSCAFLVLKCAAAAAAFASFATPAGWAVGGLLLIGVGVLAARHMYMKNAGMESDTANEAKWAAGCATTGFFVVLVAIGLALAASSSSGGGGGGGGGGGSAPVIIPSNLGGVGRRENDNSVTQ